MKQLSFFRKTLTAPVYVWNNCSSNVVDFFFSVYTTHLSYTICLLVCSLLLTGRMNKCGCTTLRESCSFSLSSPQSGLYWNSLRICSFLGHFRTEAGKCGDPMQRPFQTHLPAAGPVICPWTERGKQKEQETTYITKKKKKMQLLAMCLRWKAYAVLLESQT